MSDPTERLKILLGEELFAAAEASAADLIQTPLPQTASLAESSSRMENTNQDHVREIDQRQQKQQPQSKEQPQSKDSSVATKVIQRKVAKEVDRRHWCNSLRRAQRYLGLHNRFETGASSLIEFNSPAPHPFELDAMIVAIDVEADETNHNLVTEVGLASLDTRSLVNLAPGTFGANWLAKVQGRHFRILEHTHIRNHLYVQGDPEGFQARFGRSTIVPQRFIAATLRDCFNQFDPLVFPKKKLRNIVLVGHDIKSDIRWLERLGFSLSDPTNLVEILTTDEIQKAMKRDATGSTNLARLLTEVDIQAEGLHNAGNDAAYTLQAFIAMALKSGSTSRPVISLKERIAEAVARAEERTVEEWAAWDAAEQMSRDGGEPVPYHFSKLRG